MELARKLAEQRLIAPGDEERVARVIDSFLEEKRSQLTPQTVQIVDQLLDKEKRRLADEAMNS